MTTKTQLLDHIKANPGNTADEIGEALGCGMVTAYRLLQELRCDGMAYEVKSGKKYWYAASFGGYSPKGAA